MNKDDNSTGSQRKAVVLDFPSKGLRGSTITNKPLGKTAESKALKAYLSHADSLRW